LANPVILPASDAILTEEQARKRDLRMLAALLALVGLTLTCIVFAWRLAELTAQKSQSPWPIAYGLYGCLGLIFVGLTSLGYVLGKRSWSFKASAAGFEGNSSGGDDDEAPKPGAEP
jgi:hypothetical protein